MEKQQLGIALVGLGKYSEGQLAPALQETQHCRLAGIVTGSPDKAEKWKKKYKIPDENVYSYDNFDSISENPDIDIVYIVLPNNMHAQYTIRAAAAGKHVICEKPMAISVQECQDMIDACNKAGVRLSIGYRLHFDPYNIDMMNMPSKLGKVKTISSDNSQEMEPGEWRLSKTLAGGGPLMDLGIYCVQAAIYCVGQDPIAVTATEGLKTDPAKFPQVEQSLIWSMEFPDGARAQCTTSYAAEGDRLEVQYENGTAKLEPAFDYSGLKGESSEGKISHPKVNQQALQMDDFAQCVKENKPTRVPGEMGLRDVKILMAIYEAMRTGERVELSL